MSEEPFTIKLEEIEHHENGDATYKFDVDEKGAKDVAELGLKLIIDWIIAHAPRHR